MAILTFLLPLFFLVFSFGEILKFRFASVISFGILDLIILLILLTWLVFSKKKDYSLKIPLFLFWAVSFFSLVINFFNYEPNQIVVAFLYLIRFIAYSSLYFVFSDISKGYKTYIPKLMFFSGFIFLLIGFFQFFLFRSLKEYYYLGWDMHTNRLFSTFFDPNFAGAFLVLILIFSYILRDKIFPKDWTVIPPLFYIFTLLAIFLTYSRGAFLMLFTSVLTYSIITKKWKLILSLILTFIVAFSLMSARFDLESTNLLRVASIENRLGNINTAVNIWQRQPFGVGFNTYRYAKEKYDLSEQGNFISNAGAGVDNSFIFVLVTTGLMGLLTYLYLLYKMLKLGTGNLTENKYALTLTISLVGLLINALVINSLFYIYILIWIFILAGVTQSSLRK